MAVLGPTSQRNLERLAGNLLRLARGRRGWTQNQLAVAAGVPASTVARIEAGKRQPSLLTLGRLLAAADLEVRTRLEPYDDHDDVLDSLHAQRTPEERAAKEARHEQLAELFRTAGPGVDDDSDAGLSR